MSSFIQKSAVSQRTQRCAALHWFYYSSERLIKLHVVGQATLTHAKELTVSSSGVQFQSTVVETFHGVIRDTSYSSSVGDGFGGSASVHTPPGLLAHPPIWTRAKCSRDGYRVQPRDGLVTYDKYYIRVGK